MNDTQIIFELLRDEAHSLFVKYNLIGWEFKFINTKKRFGHCHFTNKEIALSRELTVLNFDYNFNQIILILLHEVAHAISCIKYGRQGMGHGYLWRETLLEIGGDGKRLYDSKNVIMPKGRYTYKCPCCGKELPFQRKVKRQYGCPDCCNGRFDKRFALVLVESPLCV